MTMLVINAGDGGGDDHGNVHGLARGDHMDVPRMHGPQHIPDIDSHCYKALGLQDSEY